MPIDRAERCEVADHLAALMHREIGRAEIDALRQRLFPEGWLSDDRLALYAIDRLHRRWHGSRLAVSPLQWEKLQRWIAILNTDLDWEESGYSSDLHPETPHGSLLIGCFVWLFTIAALVAAAQLYDGRPLFIWLTIGLALAPFFLGYWIVHVVRGQEGLPRPFASFEQMARFIHHAEKYGLPPYNRHVHGVPVLVRLHRVWFTMVFSAAVVVFLAVTVWPAVFWMAWELRNEQRRDSRHRHNVAISLSADDPSASCPWSR